MNTTFHTSYWFAQAPDLVLSDFTLGVITGLTDNAAIFNQPPVALTELKAQHEAFVAALAARATGGHQAIAVKNNERVKLTRLMRKLAAYVQSVAGDDLATLLLSGFSAASNNRASAPLETPAILALLNEASGQLVARVTPVLNARSYEVQTSTAGGDWKTARLACQARRIVLTGLTAGTVYNVRVRAVGGSTDYSDWSDPTSHICT